MAKRFIDTGMFEDPWFMELSKDGKIAWIFLITRCDHAGIIEINERLFKTMTGINSWETVCKELNERIKNIRNNYFFIPKFIYYQYPDFPKSNVNAQAGAIKRLKQFGLFNEEKQTVDEGLTNSSPTVGQELNNSYGYGYGNGSGSGSVEKGGVGEKTWREDYQIYLMGLRKEFKRLYENDGFIATQERLNPNVDIRLTMEKSCVNFWATEAGWVHKKKGPAKELDWERTMKNAISQRENKVYKQNGTHSRNSKEATSWEQLASIIDSAMPE